MREKNDTLSISAVEWDSPAWHAGIRAKQSILAVNGEPATAKMIETIPFTLTRIAKPTELQAVILKDWLKATTQ